MIGRTGHTAFSNAWMIVALPEDDIDGITREIVAGNDGIADQLLVRDALEQSYARLKDFEAIGMKFHRADDGSYGGRRAGSISPASCIRRAAGSNIAGGCGLRSKPKGCSSSTASS